MKVQVEIPWLNCVMVLKTDMKTQRIKYEIYPVIARTNKKGVVVNNFLTMYPIIIKSNYIESIDIEHSVTAAELLPIINAFTELDLIEYFEYKINNIHSNTTSLLRGVRYRSNRRFIASWYTNSISAYITTSDNQIHRFDVKYCVYSQKKGTITECDTGIPIDIIRLEKSWNDTVWGRIKEEDNVV